MKRKILYIIMSLIILSTFILTSCGNLSIGAGNFNFKKVHIHLGSIDRCLTIEKWYDNEGMGIEVKTKECGSLFLSEGTYILIEDKCPICDKIGK